MAKKNLFTHFKQKNDSSAVSTAIAYLPESQKPYGARPLNPHSLAQLG